MGLDVFLYRITDFAEMTRREDEFRIREHKIWKYETEDYTKLADSEKNENCRKVKELEEEMGMGPYGEDPKYKTKIEKDSSKYPDHLFKVGYFRSSYNNNGINNVLRNIIGEDLYTIFEPSSEDYYVKPNWKESLKRTKYLLEEFKKSDTVKNNVNVTQEVLWDMSDVSDGQQALDLYFEKTKDTPFEFGAFSNKNGIFFVGEPISVKAIIKGKCAYSKTEHPAVYIVYACSGYDWYAQALEIVIETIEYVLSSENPDEYYLGWSA